jgi:hypothetical protein
MPKNNQYKLIDALKAHINNLEVERERASGKTQATLAQRLEAAKRVLEWLSTRLANEQYQSAPPSGSYSLSHF